MSTSHLDRKELKRPDAFLSSASSVVEYIGKNSKAVLAVLASVLALSLCMAFYQSYKTKRGEEANSALYTAKKSLNTVLAAHKSNDWESASKSQLDEVEKVAKTYKGSLAGFEAWLVLGDLYFDHANNQKALELYKNAQQAAPGRAMKALALLSQSYAYENLADYTSAINALNQVISISDKSVKAEAMLSLARNQNLKGDTAAALKTYEQVSKDFPNSEFSKTADQYKK